MITSILGDIMSVNNEKREEKEASQESVKFKLSNRGRTKIFTLCSNNLLWIEMDWNFRMAWH